MRAAAMTVWIFLNLIFFGMCGYLYLIWSQYWFHAEKQRLFSETPRQMSSALDLSYDIGVHENFNNTVPIFSENFRRSANGDSSNSKEFLKSSSNLIRPLNTIVKKSNGNPRFPNIHKALLEFDTDKYTCDDITTSDDCDDKTAKFKHTLLKEFHRVLMSDSRVFKSGLDSHNIYNVKYDGSNRKEYSTKELLCKLKRVSVQTVTSEDEPFKHLGYRIPKVPLRQNMHFNTCAVVTSSGALLDSRLGEFIDAHDAVLRFNNAPTANYSEDVGAKTTFRILNSQVITKPEYNFFEDDLYRNISILAWDPANFSSTLVEWYHHPDYQLFPVYKRFLEDRSDADVHLLKPQVLWDLWAILQDSSPYRLRKNPPSSGFIGLWFLLHRCRHVRMFEYVPSVRVTRRCHYYVQRIDVDCTLGAWHPLAQEKTLAEKLRYNSDIEVFQRGYIDIHGFKELDCS